MPGRALLRKPHTPQLFPGTEPAASYSRLLLLALQHRLPNWRFTYLTAPKHAAGPGAAANHSFMRANCREGPSCRSSPGQALLPTQQPGAQEQPGGSMQQAQLCLQDKQTALGDHFGALVCRLSLLPWQSETPPGPSQGSSKPPPFRSTS